MAHKSDHNRLESALNIFQAYKTWRETGLDQRMRRADMLYRGYKRAGKDAMWPGTQKERSDPQLKVTADYIESILPTLMYNLFWAGGDRFFDVVTLGGAEHNRQVSERLNMLITAVDRKGENGLWALNWSLRHLLRYGLCFTQVVANPNLGRPQIISLPPRNVYFNPTAGEWVDDSAAWFRRSMVSVRKLLEMDHLPGYNIPSKKKLVSIAESHWKSTQADQDRDSVLADQMLSRAEQELPEEFKHVPVLQYEDSNRVMWIAGQSLSSSALLFNEVNQLEAVSLSGSTYRPLLEAFGGEGVPDIVGHEHQIQQKV